MGVQFNRSNIVNQTCLKKEKNFDNKKKISIGRGNWYSVFLAEAVKILS